GDLSATLTRSRSRAQTGGTQWETSTSPRPMAPTATGPSLRRNSRTVSGSTCTGTRPCRSPLPPLRAPPACHCRRVRRTTSASRRERQAGMTARPSPQSTATASASTTRTPRAATKFNTKSFLALSRLPIPLRNGPRIRSSSTGIRMATRFRATLWARDPFGGRDQLLEVGRGPEGGEPGKLEPPRLDAPLQSLPGTDESRSLIPDQCVDERNVDCHLGIIRRNTQDLLRELHGFTAPAQVSQGLSASRQEWNLAGGRVMLRPIHDLCVQCLGLFRLAAEEVDIRKVEGDQGMAWTQLERLTEFLFRLLVAVQQEVGETEIDQLVRLGSTPHEIGVNLDRSRRIARQELQLTQHRLADDIVRETGQQLLQVAAGLGALPVPAGDPRSPEKMPPGRIVAHDLPDHLQSLPSLSLLIEKPGTQASHARTPRLETLQLSENLAGAIELLRLEKDFEKGPERTRIAGRQLARLAEEVGRSLEVGGIPLELETVLIRVRLEDEGVQEPRRAPADRGQTLHGTCRQDILALVEAPQEAHVVCVVVRTHLELQRITAHAIVSIALSQVRFDGFLHEERVIERDLDGRGPERSAILAGEPGQKDPAGVRLALHLRSEHLARRRGSGDLHRRAGDGLDLFASQRGDPFQPAEPSDQRHPQTGRDHLGTRALA